jgi:deoxyribodipyrimidine photo-lyase
MTDKEIKTDTRRVLHLNSFEDDGSNPGPVVYWMSRDQRAQNNWALLYAQDIAINNNRDLIVFFNLTKEFLHASPRHYNFMIQGLAEVEEELNSKRINLVVEIGDPKDNLLHFINQNKVSFLVTDFSPIKISRKWKSEVAQEINREIKIPFHEVDAHNIIPCFYASNKQEYGAYTLRPKIHKLLPEFLTHYPKVKENYNSAKTIQSDLKRITQQKKYSNEYEKGIWVQSGTKRAQHIFDNFLQNKLNSYSEQRNDPTLDQNSHLSPYLHFGQISAQEIVLKVMNKHEKNTYESFIEELVVRRELSDNYCYHNSNYDNYLGFPEWAQKSLEKHSTDKRPFIYDLEQLENSQTHDDLWNSAQKEMVYLGKMHGYLRMYWAKKILEWSKDYKTAQKNAIYLNDKYELDGRDPNGYTGIAWSIGGVHDRPWFEREIFGQIRYMNYQGCAKKFDIQKYIKKIDKEIKQIL